MEFSSSRLAGRCTVGGGGAVVGVGGVGVLGGWTFEAASDHFFGINPVARYRQKKKKTPPPPHRPPHGLQNSSARDKSVGGGGVGGQQHDAQIIAIFRWKSWPITLGSCQTPALSLRSPINNTTSYTPR